MKISVSSPWKKSFLYFHSAVLNQENVEIRIITVYHAADALYSGYKKVREIGSKLKKAKCLSMAIRINARTP